jgi:hypothetical protein
MAGKSTSLEFYYGAEDFFQELIGIKFDPNYFVYDRAEMFGKESFMSMQADIERLQIKNLRRRQRVEGEANLKKNLTEPHDADLAVTVTANRQKAENKDKIDQLKRNNS